MKRIPLTPVGRPYGGVPVGGIFYVRPKEARILVKLKKAREIEESPAVQPTQPVVRPGREAETEVTADNAKPVRRRQYKRRDMTAEPAD